MVVEVVAAGCIWQLLCNSTSTRVVYVCHVEVGQLAFGCAHSRGGGCWAPRSCTWR